MDEKYQLIFDMKKHLENYMDDLRGDCSQEWTTQDYEIQNLIENANKYLGLQKEGLNKKVDG